MNIRGKIIHVSEVQSIPKRDGTMFQKREAVIETPGGKWANSMCFEVVGDDVNHQFLREGLINETRRQPMRLPPYFVLSFC